MYNLSQIIDTVLFFDIETVCQTKTLGDLSPRMQKLWLKKAMYQREKTEEISEEDFYFQRAGIFAEFNKIVCISCGYWRQHEGKVEWWEITCHGHNEKEILVKFGEILRKWFEKPNRKICGHNLKEFDIPVFCRRSLVHKIDIPATLDVQGKKPWEINFMIDTQELWKFGDYKANTSLDLLAAIFDIPSSKDDIDGSEVSKVYWIDGDLERIKTYCEKDVKTTARVLLALNNLPALEIP